VSFQGRIIYEDIKKTYKIKKELGTGNYGSVRIIAKRSFMKKRFAMKSIHRDRITNDIKLIEKELDFLMNIDHPNIIGFYEIYMDDQYFHFVLQLCEGSDLYEKIDKMGGRITEERSSQIMK
jgi:calcium-dependent protein kinase